MLKKIFTIFLIILFMIFPFSVYADDEDLELDMSSDDISKTLEVSASINELPSINARHAVIFDRNSNHILYGKNENEKCKMASTTKIMTAIVVLENANLSDTVIVSSKSAGTGGSRLGLSTNDELSVESLLYGLMLCSGNDAAVALAEYVGESINGFADMMNSKALSLGLTSTHFVTPHGLDNDDHYTTAFELASLTNYALKNETFAKIVKTKTYTITLNGYPKTLNNTNELLGNLDGVYGVKTGFTNGANRCLVTSCKRGDLDIICVVLGCDTKKDRTKDSINLINYIFNNFSVINVKDIIYKNFNEWNLLHKNSFTINKGRSQYLELSLDEDDFSFTNIAVNNSFINSISTQISFDSYFETPINSGTDIGKIVLKINDLDYLYIDIINTNTISKKNAFDYFFYIFKHYCNFFKSV